MIFVASSDIIYAQKSAITYNIICIMCHPKGGKSSMKVLLIVLGCLLALFLTFIAIACCKVSGDTDEDAEKRFEEWLKSKREEAAKGDLKEGAE